MAKTPKKPSSTKVTTPKKLLSSYKKAQRKK